MTLSCYYNNATRYYSQVSAHNPVVVLRFNIADMENLGKDQ